MNIFDIIIIFIGILPNIRIIRWFDFFDIHVSIVK